MGKVLSAQDKKLHRKMRGFEETVIWYDGAVLIDDITRAPARAVQSRHSIKQQRYCMFPIERVHHLYDGSSKQPIQSLHFFVHFAVAATFVHVSTGVTTNADEVK